MGARGLVTGAASVWTPSRWLVVIIVSRVMCHKIPSLCTGDDNRGCCRANVETPQKQSQDTGEGCEEIGASAVAIALRLAGAEHSPDIPVP